MSGLNNFENNCSSYTMQNQDSEKDKIDEPTDCKSLAIF